MVAVAVELDFRRLLAVVAAELRARRDLALAAGVRAFLLLVSLSHRTPPLNSSVVKGATASDARCIPAPPQRANARRGPRVGGVAPSSDIGRIFSVVAPCPRGASRVSVLAAPFTTDC